MSPMKICVQPRVQRCCLGGICVRKTACGWKSLGVSISEGVDKQRCSNPWETCLESREASRNNRKPTSKRKFLIQKIWQITSYCDPACSRRSTEDARLINATQASGEKFSPLPVEWKRACRIVGHFELGAVRKFDTCEFEKGIMWVSQHTRLLFLWRHFYAHQTAKRLLR